MATRKGRDKGLSRREFLRGAAAVGIGVPLLESLGKAAYAAGAAQAGEEHRKLCVFYQECQRCYAGYTEDGCQQDHEGGCTRDVQCKVFDSGDGKYGCTDRDFTCAVIEGGSHKCELFNCTPATFDCGRWQDTDCTDYDPDYCSLHKTGTVEDYEGMEEETEATGVARQVGDRAQPTIKIGQSILS